MNASVVSPLDLARPAIVAPPIPESTYDHTMQRRVYPEGTAYATGYTPNGTQTFTGGGQPSDADND